MIINVKRTRNRKIKEIVDTIVEPSPPKKDKQQQPLGDRFIYILGEINSETARDVIAMLLDYQCSDPMREVTVILDSYGGEVDSMFAITDVMDIMITPIRTICLGKAMSAAAFLFICGTCGRRFMTKHSRLMFHQMSQMNTGGTVSDIIINTEEIKFLQGQMIEEITKRSKISSAEKVQKLIDRDTYLRPEQAIELGFCDGILTRLG
jgi:ATP-dependent Clp protease protease subunit